MIATPAHRAFADSIVMENPDMNAAAHLVDDATPMDCATAMMLGLPPGAPYAVAAAMVQRRMVDFGRAMF